MSLQRYSIWNQKSRKINYIKEHKTEHSPKNGRIIRGKSGFAKLLQLMEEQKSDQTSLWLKESWILSVFIFFTVTLRFYRLGYHSLWADEGFSIYMGIMDLPSFFYFITHHDAHPPFYYLLIHILLPYGKSELFLRLPSAIFGILTALTTYRLARKLFNPSTAYIALFFMAFSASHIYIVQEVRMYPLFVYLSILSTLFFHELRENNTISRNIYYTLVSILIIYTHYLGFVVILSHFLSCILIFRENYMLKRLMFIYLIIILSFLPWMPIVVAQFKAKIGPTLLEQVRLETVLGTFMAFFAGYTFLIKMLSLEYFIILILSILLPLICTIFILKIPVKKNNFLFLLLNLFLPILILSIVSLLHLRHLYSIKYLSFVSPLYFILLSHTLYHIFQSDKRLISLIFLSAFFLINCMALYNWYFIPDFQKQRWKEAITYINEVKNPDDAYIIQDFFQIHCIEYYLKEPKKIYMVHPDRWEKPLQEISKSHRRIWYIASCGWRIRDPQYRIITWLGEHMSLMETRTYNNIDPYADIVIQLYERKYCKIPEGEQRPR